MPQGNTIYSPKCGNTLSKGNAFVVLRSVECGSGRKGYFSKWPKVLRRNSSGTIAMFCKPCYTQGGIAILRQMKKKRVERLGKQMERIWKGYGNVAPVRFRLIFVVLIF